MTTRPHEHEEDERMHSPSSASPAVLPSSNQVRSHTNSDLKPDTPPSPLGAKMLIENLNFYYGKSRALKNITLSIPPNQVTAFIGPSGCGKSTLLRTLNRMNDVIPGTRVEGRVEMDGEDIYAPGTDVASLRRRAGMVFQKSNPFPRSIFDNVAYGLRINNLTHSKSELAQR